MKTETSSPTVSESKAARKSGSDLPARPLSEAAILVGTAAGFAMVSLINSIATPFVLHTRGPTITAIRDAWDLALTSSVGALGGIVLASGMWAFRRSHFRKWWVLPVLLHGLAALVLVELTLGEAIAHQALTARDGHYPRLFETLMLLGTSFGIALAHAIGVFAGRRWWTWIPWSAIAVAGAVVNTVVFRDDFFESHSVAGWATAAALAGVATTLLSDRFATRPLFARRAVLLAAFPLCALIVHPSNRSRLELFRSPAALGAWAHAATVWSVPAIPGDTPLPKEIAASWLGYPTDETEVAPSPQKLVHGAPIVVFITIDAVRADVILDDQNNRSLPNFAHLKEAAAFFTDARSAGSQTAVSLSTLFSGRYFSELYWSKHGTGSSRYDYPADDNSPRFPALLGDHGVSTFKVDSIKFLANDFGVAPGFSKDLKLVDDRRHAFANEVVDPILVRLRSAGPEPLFLYAHLMEPHAPYDRGGSVGTPFSRYKSEIAVADAALGRILKAIGTSKLTERAVVIVSADHGEAFGEHDTFEHTKTLYEELIRVPLLVLGPGVAPRRIDTPVSLIDVGPTVLDIFGVSTPADDMGQSLVPMLAGDDTALTRPIFAEGRLRRSLVVGPIKVISDARRKVVEGFDLSADPGETVNLYDEDRPRVLPALAAMQRFFDARTCNRPGYSPVYKP